MQLCFSFLAITPSYFLPLQPSNQFYVIPRGNLFATKTHVYATAGSTANICFLLLRKTWICKWHHIFGILFCQRYKILPFLDAT